MLPRHHHYVEIFAGSLAVLLAKPESPMETVNDLDGGLCVGPETRLLADDLTWVQAGSVQVGDRLIGFDEFNPGQPRQSGLMRAPESFRKWQITEVTNVKRIMKPSYRLTFSDGTEVVASGDHQWLAGSHTVGSAGRGWHWQQTKGMWARENSATGRSSWVLKLTDVTQPERSWEAGWVAGFYDGEGNVISAGVKKSGWRISVSQKIGPEADLCERLLKERGFQVRRTSVPGREAHHLDKVNLTILGGKPETLRFLMAFRPQRLIQNFVDQCLPRASLYSRPHTAVALVGKEFVGEIEVVAIETESHTYVAEGLASHNCNFWKQLRDRPEELIRACALTPHSRGEHAQAQADEFGDSELEWARRVWVQLTQGRLGVRNTTGWRYFIAGASKSTSMPRVQEMFVERMAAVAARLHKVSLESLPAVELVKRYGRDPNVLIYADPPYLMGSHDGVMDASGYREAMADELSHRELAEALNSCRAAVVLSGYAHPLYDDELYAGWSRVELHTFTGNGLRKDGSGPKSEGKRVEVVWANRPLTGARARVRRPLVSMASEEA
jgi:DNA adenine methylase